MSAVPLPLTKPCLVCGGRSDGAHFGAVEACRACAAFFRRTVSRDKEYTCCDGGHCIIDPNVRNICRGCRFERCLAVGMQTKNVQKRRDGHGPHPKLPHCIPSTSTSSPETKPIPMFISEEQGMPTLRRIHTQYSQLKGIRKIVHLKGVMRPPRPSIFADVMEMNLIEAGLIADFAFSSFASDFKDIDDMQKKVLGDLFFPTFLSFESAFATALSREPDKIVLSNGDYMDYFLSFLQRNKRTVERDTAWLIPPTVPWTALSSFYTTKKGGKQVDTELAVRIFGPTFRFFTDHCIIPIMERGVDTYEFYALSALCLWDFDHEVITSETCRVGKRIRIQIIKELIFYYRHIRRYSDESERLAELMLLITPILRMGKRLVEDIEVGRLFNIYNYDEAMHDIVNVSSKVL